MQDITLNYCIVPGIYSIYRYKYFFLVILDLFRARCSYINKPSNHQYSYREQVNNNWKNTENRTLTTVLYMYFNTLNLCQVN